MGYLMVLSKYLLFIVLMALCLTGCGGGADSVSSGSDNERCLGNPAAGNGGNGPAVRSKDGMTPILFGGVGAYVPGELLVKFEQDLDAMQAGMMVESLGAESTPVERMSDGAFSGWVKVRLPDGETVVQSMRLFADQPGIMWVQPNFLYFPAVSPNDPEYFKQWGLKNTGQAVNGVIGTSGFDLGIEHAWDAWTDCSRVLVAVIDTGIDYGHADLQTSMWDPPDGQCVVNGARVPCPRFGWDFRDEHTDGAAGPDNDPMDRNGHGTHVAGIIGAMGNNGFGISGVCWRSEIMAVRIFPTQGGTDTATVIEGIDFAVANGARVFNMSFSGYGGFDQAYYEAMLRIRDAGGIVVAAAGNDSYDVDSIPVYPAGFDLDNIISVGAMNAKGELAAFSNYGRLSVDLVAPGTNIQSTYPFYLEHNAPEDFSTGWLGFTDTAWNHSLAMMANGKQYDVLANPPDALIDPAAGYTPGRTTTAYKTFDFSGVDIAAVSMSARYDVADDFFRIYCKDTGGDPAVGGNTLADFSGNSSDAFVPLAYDLSVSGRTAACSIGVYLEANAADTGQGVGIYNFQIHSRSYDPAGQSYKFFEGTSMSAPHVSGLAALLWAQYPQASYRDVILAILDGGKTEDSLDDVICTGARADALGAQTALSRILGD